MRQLRPPGRLRHLFRRGKKHECGNRADLCPDCLSTLHRERQYLERLRSAAVPDAPEGLAARLLARTEELAKAPPQPAVRISPPVKVLGLAASGAATTAGALGLAALIMGGDPSPMANAAAGPAGAVEASLDGVSTLGGTAPAGTSVEAFRSEGWLCPELTGLGLHVVAVGMTDFDGEPAVELHLSDGEHYARIIEQHPGPVTARSSPLAASPQDARGPVNVLTGHFAAEDGFSAALQYEIPGGGSLWVNPGTPWTAIYQAPGTTFTYVSDLPPEKADDGLIPLSTAAAVSADSARGGQGRDVGAAPTEVGPKDAVTGSAPEAGDPLADRFLRGLQRMFGPFFP